VTDFYDRLEQQLVDAGRRRQRQGAVRRVVAGRGRAIVVASAAVAVLVVAVSGALPSLRTSSVTGEHTAPVAPPPPAAPAPIPLRPGSLAGIRIAVFNATAQPDLARRVGAALRSRHARVSVFGSGPAHATVVRYTPGAKSKARRVAAVLGVTRVERYDPSLPDANPPESARAEVIVLTGYDLPSGRVDSAGGYPNSIALLGDSAAAGPIAGARQSAAARENSWATGTNPAVGSVYLRIRARNPRISGHSVDLTRPGADADALVDQARRAVALDPLPALIVIQIMENDIQCPTSQIAVQAFGPVRTALDILAIGAPGSKVFVVSRFGRPGTYAKSLSPAERRSVGGTGACDFIDPQGRVSQRKVASFEETIRQYEFQLDHDCQKFPDCRYDGGAFGRIVDRRAYLASDLRHLSIKGQATAAAVAWAAMQRAQIVPDR
jgi:hypothetical protein